MRAFFAAVGFGAMLCSVGLIVAGLVVPVIHGAWKEHQLRQAEHELRQREIRDLLRSIDMVKR